MSVRKRWHVERDGLFAQVRGGVIEWVDCPSAAAAFSRRRDASRIAGTIEGARTVQRSYETRIQHGAMVSVLKAEGGEA